MNEPASKCVYKCYKNGESIQVVQFLEQEGIEAQVLDHPPLDPVPSHGQGQVLAWVVVAEPVAEKAKEVLEHFPAWLANRRRFKEELGPVDAACEECGQSSEFPGEMRGTVQDCPNCGAFLDVPDDEEQYDWSEAESMPSEEDLDAENEEEEDPFW